MFSNVLKIVFDKRRIEETNLVSFPQNKLNALFLESVLKSVQKLKSIFEAFLKQFGWHLWVKLSILYARRFKHPPFHPIKDKEKREMSLS